MKYLIVGLGNIGAEYELTRHNIGFLVLDNLADEFNVEFSTSRYADYTSFKYKSKQIHLIKPTTYMNLSGKAVMYWLQNLKISIENLLVIVDDISIPFGKLRIRSKGSSAGHNGLKNIEQFLNTRDYPRLKFGVGNNFSRGQQANYVLSNFEDKEFKDLPHIIGKTSNIVLSFCSIGIIRTMNMYND